MTFHNDRYLNAKWSASPNVLLYINMHADREQGEKFSLSLRLW